MRRVRGTESSGRTCWKSDGDFCTLEYMKKNVQITIDERTLVQVDRAGDRLGLKRSHIVREALRDWLRRQAVESFEQEWIAALRRNPDDAERAETWIGVQSWGDE